MAAWHPSQGPSIGLGRLVVITLAMVAPATSVFLTYGSAYRTAGPAIILSYALGSLLVLLVMFCYAEVGSVFPEAGGDYALASHSLGPRAGRIVGTVFALKGAVLPAVLAGSASVYLHELFAGVPLTLTIAAMLLLILGLGLLDLKVTSRLMTTMVVIEVLAFMWFATTAAATIHLPAHVGGPVVFHASGLWAPIATAAVPALYSLNGPQGCLYYSEEVRGQPEGYGRAVVLVTLITMAIELLGVTLGTLALTALGTVSPVSLPLLAVVRHGLFGRVGQELLLACIVVGLFNSALATAMSYGRVYYAMARDWPHPGLIRRWIGHADRRGVPRPALVVLVALNLGLVLAAPVNSLIVLLGALVMVVYGTIVVGALFVRRQVNTIPYRMPGWPWVPLLALLGLLVLLPHVPVAEMLVMAAVLGLGTIRVSCTR
ncbi:MAG: APC family permease [Clostridia bacterium]